MTTGVMGKLQVHRTLPAGETADDLRYVIEGGRALKGRMPVDAAKNAVLPLMAASLLTETDFILEAVPPLTDVWVMQELLAELGVRVEAATGRLRLRAEGALHPEAPYDLVSRMRASFLVAGPLLARLGRAHVPLPGGCTIGVRPVDLHLKGFAALGARVEEREGAVILEAPQGLRGAHIYLDFPSVTATENLMMAAVLSRGTTTIENAAAEPEVVDLANCLNEMGAHVTGAGTRVIRIKGRSRLDGVRYRPIPDRIEAATFLLMGAISGGEVLVGPVIPQHLRSVLAKLVEAGVEVAEEGEWIRVGGSPAARQGVDVITLPFPGFPTDLQAPWSALALTLPGTSLVTETLFENRFLHLQELRRLGGQIRQVERTAVIEGGGPLTAAPVTAHDLRGGAALVTAALAAWGRTEIRGVEHLERGYARLPEKLAGVGARVERRFHS